MLEIKTKKYERKLFFIWGAVFLLAILMAVVANNTVGLFIVQLLLLISLLIGALTAIKQRKEHNSKLAMISLVIFGILFCMLLLLMISALFNSAPVDNMADAAKSTAEIASRI